jgi:hypothetical protein
MRASPPPFRKRAHASKEWVGAAASTCENQRGLSLQRVNTSSIEVSTSTEETG